MPVKHVGRKLYHLLGGLGLLSLYFLAGRERAFTLYALLLAVVVVVDLARIRIPAFNSLIYRHFGSFIRTSEQKKLTGNASYILGVALALFLYRTDIAAAAVCFLAFGDVAATTVGERYGKTKVTKDKSLEGTLAFIGAACIGGFLLIAAGLPLGIGLIAVGAVVAAGVELLPVPVNDNLMIPLVSGGVMELIQRVSSSM